MSTIRDVANLAGVGLGTVSRAINGTGYVAPDTKNKVMKAAEELNYTPNELARQLLKKKNHIVGIMIPDLAHPFFSKILRCLDMELGRNGYNCFVCDTGNEKNRQQKYLDMLDRNIMDGIITCSGPPEDYVSRKNRAIVSMDRFWSEDTPNVFSDQMQTAELAANAFLHSGCRRIVQFRGIATTNESSIRHNEQLEKILYANGCEVENIRTQWNSLSYAVNKGIVMQNFDLIRDADGLFANDIGAMSCLIVAQMNGIHVPEQLKIIAYDGTEITGLTFPQLAVIEQDCEKIAQTCVSLVLDMIDGKEPDCMEITIPVIWKKGGTV